MGKGQSIAGLVLGLAAIVMALVVPGIVGSCGCLPVAIVGLVLSVTGGKKLAANNLPKGIATAGLVIGIIAVVLSAIVFVTCGICNILCAAGGCAADAAADAAAGAAEEALNGWF